MIACLLPQRQEAVHDAGATQQHTRCRQEMPPCQGMHPHAHLSLASRSSNAASMPRRCSSAACCASCAACCSSADRGICTGVGLAGRMLSKNAGPDIRTPTRKTANRACRPQQGPWHRPGLLPAAPSIPAFAFGGWPPAARHPPEKREQDRVDVPARMRGSALRTQSPHAQVSSNLTRHGDGCPGAALVSAPSSQESTSE